MVLGFQASQIFQAKPQNLLSCHLSSIWGSLLLTVLKFIRVQLGTHINVDSPLLLVQNKISNFRLRIQLKVFKGEISNGKKSEIIIDCVTYTYSVIFISCER